MAKLLKRQRVLCSVCAISLEGHCEQFCREAHFEPRAEILANYPHGSTRIWEWSWAITKFVVLLRDKKRCFHCKKPLAGYEVHHLRHRSVGGSNHPMNLVCLCQRCHITTFGSAQEKAMIKEKLKLQHKRFWTKLGVQK